MIINDEILHQVIIFDKTFPAEKTDNVWSPSNQTEASQGRRIEGKTVGSPSVDCLNKVIKSTSNSWKALRANGPPPVFERSGPSAVK